MYRTEARVSQTATLSPQVLQSIKLLQFTQEELHAFVEAELEKNPFLDRSEEATPETGKIAQDQPAPPVGDTGRHPGSSDRSVLSVGEKDSDWQQERIVEQTTLQEYLEGQLLIATRDPSLRMIAEHIIHSLEPSGYLTETVANIAMRLGTDPAAVERALALVQTFEPTGIAARNVSECLAAQLAELDRLDPAMQSLLDNLELLARKDLGSLRRICGVDQEDFADMLAEIRALNPRPGSGFEHETMSAVTPDVTVVAQPDGGWKVQVNDDALPRVLVNRDYYAMLSGATSDRDEQLFLSECLQSANWLTRCLDQRVQTILKVTTEIVRQQRAFFEQGVEHMRPLRLSKIADALDIHESTVSRVTSNKVIETSRGTFPMKFFFPAALQASDGGQDHAANAVHHRIRKLIDAEPATEPLSDDAIVKRLKDMDIRIARRTVTKYREAMRIPSSLHRRREKCSYSEPMTAA